MKVIYIAGPYTGEMHDGRSFFQIHTNIMFAREYAKKVFGLGAFAFTPHLNSFHMELDLKADPEFFRYADLEILSRCDAVLLIPGWERSKGSNMEWREIMHLGMPVFQSLEDLSSWLDITKGNQGAGNAS